ncbi:MAG: L-ribulose-5-phosphate 4-epimerase AraD [Planctomycetota bacterium]
MLDALKESVYQANIALVDHRLVILTWGNVSGIDRDNGLVVIKPSGVPYSEMTPDSMVVVDLDGRRVDGTLKPSSDLPTHLALYRAWPSVGGVAHTHSLYATMFAQAERDIPCFGTTHADYFYGDVPVTRIQTQDDVATDYEANAGRLIVDTFTEKHLSPTDVSAVLVAKHGPFSWGATPGTAVEASVVAETVAQMAAGALGINPDASRLPEYLLNKHFYRKHGSAAYYGQTAERH